MKTAEYAPKPTGNRDLGLTHQMSWVKRWEQLTGTRPNVTKVKTTAGKMGGDQYQFNDAEGNPQSLHTHTLNRSKRNK